MARRIARPLAVGSFLISSALTAQQLPEVRDQLVVTATGDEQPADGVAAACTVISATELQAAGVASVSDALRWVPGVTVLRSGADTGVTSLFSRGTASTQTLVMWDGVRLNSPLFGGYDWSLPLALGLDRMEIVRGPYSALYGGDAVGGVVQLFPARATANKASLLVEGGGDGWRRGEVEATLVSGGWEAVVAGGSRDGDGPLPNDDFSSRAALIGLTTSMADGGRLSLLLHRTTNLAEIPFSGARATPRRSTKAFETVAAVPMRWRLGAGSELDLTISRVERDLRFVDPDDPSGFVRSDTTADSDAARVVLHNRWGDHNLIVGGDWQGNHVTDGSNVSVNLDGVEQTTRSFFFQDSWKPWARFAVLVGARWDEASPWGTELSPRATVSWEGRPVRAWVSIGRAFRAPSLGELYYPYSGNPNLSPERSWSMEAGFVLPVSGGRSVLQLVGFSTRQRDLIDFDFARHQNANVERALQDGAEASWSAVIGERGRASAALTWLNARDGTGRPLLRRAAWSGSLTFAGPIGGRAEGAVILVWVGRRTDVDPAAFARVGQASFVTATTAATVPLAPALAARVRVENAADRRYEEVCGYPAPGRRFIVGLTTLLH